MGCLVRYHPVNSNSNILTLTLHHSQAKIFSWRLCFQITVIYILQLDEDTTFNIHQTSDKIKKQQVKRIKSLYVSFTVVFNLLIVKNK
jgi:hypothetical protein